jgi:TolB-like protein
MSDEPRGTTEFWADLRRHPAFQAAVLFGGGSWAVLQALDIFGIDTGVVRLLGATMIVVFVMLALSATVLVMRRRAGGQAVREGLSMRVVAIGAAVLLLLGTGAWIARPYVLGNVRTGADVIVVLPFQASGPGVELLGEGLVDLLSANLDEVGAIRTVNPRTTLHQYRQHATNGSIDLDGALRVGRAVGAGSVLLGSVIAAGNEARVTAELHAVSGGRVIARAQKSGPADNVLALVDELSVELMRDIWRSREPLPQLRVSAITTPSVPAIRAYMRGEQFYRRVQWDSARVAFVEAVEHDSTFALAHFRLAETYGWSETIGSADSRRHSSAAVRFADRLPARERALVLAHQKHEEGDIDALAAFREYTVKYPDDATGWYMLADARFHSATVTGDDLTGVLESFERAHTMDPTYAQPYAHMLEVSLMLGDSAKYDAYLGNYATLVDSAATRVYRLLRTVRWGPRAHALTTIEETLKPGNGPPQGSLVERFTVAAALRGYDEKPDVEFFVAAADVIARAFGEQPGAHANTLALRASTLAGAGRFHAADSLLAEVRTHSMDQALGAALPFLTSGAAPAYAFATERDMLARAPARRGPAYWRAIEALQRGDGLAGAKEIAVVKRDSTLRGFALPQHGIDGLDAWLAAVQGDTTAVTRLRRAILGGGYSIAGRNVTGPLRLQLAMMQVERPQSRAEGINRLLLTAMMEPGIAPLVYLPLAEAYRAGGDNERAAHWYNRFITVWQDADPEMQARVTAARAALARLGAERRTS